MPQRTRSKTTQKTKTSSPHASKKAAKKNTASKATVTSEKNARAVTKKATSRKATASKKTGTALKQNGALRTATAAKKSKSSTTKNTIPKKKAISKKSNGPDRNRHRDEETTPTCSRCGGPLVVQFSREMADLDDATDGQAADYDAAMLSGDWGDWAVDNKEEYCARCDTTTITIISREAMAVISKKIFDDVADGLAP